MNYKNEIIIDNLYNYLNDSSDQYSNSLSYELKDSIYDNKKGIELLLINGINTKSIFFCDSESTLDVLIFSDNINDNINDKPYLEYHVDLEDRFDVEKLILNLLKDENYEVELLNNPINENEYELN